MKFIYNFYDNHSITDGMIINLILFLAFILVIYVLVKSYLLVT